jgi:hypothetical protein
MDALLTTIVLWLSVNFNLPGTFELPKVEFVRPIEITFFRYQAFTAEAQRQVLASQAADNATNGRREVVAVYDARRNRILLPHGWNGQTPAEVSVVVHELLHHLQNKAGLKYACPAEREKLAYEAQEKWLGLFGQSLQSEFDIDAFTLKVSTSCGF